MSFNFLIFNEKLRKYCRDEVIYSIMDSATMQQVNVDPELPPTAKIKLKRMEELKEKPKTVKQLDNNRETSTWTTARQCLSRQTPTVQKQKT